jgi:hypothetical protein
MWWYLGVIFSIYLILWVGSGFLQVMVEKERKDPMFSKKMDKHRAKWVPKFDFIENLIGWIFGLALIYFIFLGGSL